MFLAPYGRRALYKCDCCGAAFSGSHFILMAVFTGKHFCCRCEKAWLDFCRSVKVDA